MYHPAFRSLSFLLVVVTLLTGSRFVAKDNAWLPLTDELSAKVDHPFVPLATVSSKIFTGEEVDEQAGQRIPTRVEETVLPRLEQVAGIEVTVVEVADYHNGEFHDRTAEYFAQGADGTVYYVGERDDEYEHGKIVDQDGSWLSGDQGIRPGQFMSADLTVGETFVPENHPNVAIEQSTVIAVDQTITTAAGDFDGCVVTKEVHLPKGTTERKTYCPGVGLVREDFLGGYSELVEFETPA